MATVYQASAGVSNSNSITISMWCRAHVTSPIRGEGEGVDYFSLLDFGELDTDGYPTGHLGLTTNTTGSNGIDFTFGGEFQSLRGRAIYTTDAAFVSGSGTLYRPNADATVHGNPFYAMQGADLSDYYYDPYFTPIAQGYTKPISSLVDPEKWFHLAVALSCVDAASYDSPSSVAIRVVVNGVEQQIIGPNGILQSSGHLIPIIQCYDLGYNQAGGNIGRVGPAFWTAGTDPVFTGNLVIPGFNLGLNGCEIGIPSQLVSPNKNTQLLDMADVQIWVGQYIDPTNSANFEKFVSIAGGRGFPVSPHASAIAFGPQTYLFTGNSSTFYDNQGTGGVFSKSGTLSNISGPSY